MMLCGAISQNAYTDCMHPYLNSLTCIRENTFGTNVVNGTTKHIFRYYIVLEGFAILSDSFMCSRTVM